MSRQRRLRTQVATPPAHQETRSVRKPESHRSAHIKGHPISGPHEISTPQALNFFALRGQGPPAILCFKKSVLWRHPVGWMCSNPLYYSGNIGEGKKVKKKRDRANGTRLDWWVAGWLFTTASGRRTDVMRMWGRRASYEKAANDE